MKKIYILPLCLALTISLIGCSSSKTKIQEENDLKEDTSIVVSNEENIKPNEQPAIIGQEEDIIVDGDQRTNDSNASEKKENELVEEKIEPETNEEPVIKKENTDFQNSNWGDSIEQVKKDNRDLNLEEDDNALGALGTTIAGKKADILFGFENNKLTQGFISFNESHSNEYFYVTDFSSIKELLTGKYGKPIIDEEFWFDDFYKDDPTDYGMAVLVGDLTYKAVWQTNNTEITLFLVGDNYRAKHFISYEPINYEQKIDDSRL